MEKITPETTAARRGLMNHEATIIPTSFHRMALPPEGVQRPNPIIAPIIVWVVETGSSRDVAQKRKIPRVRIAQHMPIINKSSCPWKVLMSTIPDLIVEVTRAPVFVIYETSVFVVVMRENESTHTKEIGTKELADTGNDNSLPHFKSL